MAPRSTNEPQRKKRRRRVARTEDFSSSDSSDSDSSNNSDTQESKNDLSNADQDFDMKDAADVNLEIEEDSSLTSQYKDVEHPKSLIPDQLVDTKSAEAEAEKSQKFNEYYLTLMTTGFGEDLNALRESKDFTAQSMPLIIRSLKEGINMFDADQRNLILSSASSS